MNRIEKASVDLREMDELSMMTSPVHDLHPAAKLVMTAAYILVTVSYGKYDLSGLLVMVLYPAVLFSLSGVSVRTCFYKLRLVLPFVCLVGLFNPFFDRTVLLTVGRVPISGGILSMLTLMLKGVLCLAASFLLAAITRIEAICAVLHRIHVPDLMLTVLLLTVRYVSVMMEEVSVMTTAYSLRAPGQKGLHVSAWGSFLGQLLLRSMDRAGELYESMQLRGYCRGFLYADIPRLQLRDYLCILVIPALFLLMRYYNLAEALGRLLM